MAAGVPKGDFEHISYSETRSLLSNTLLTPTMWQQPKESPDPSWNAPHKTPCWSSEANQALDLERAVILCAPTLIRAGRDCCSPVLVLFVFPCFGSGWPGWPSLGPICILGSLLWMFKCCMASQG